MPSAGGDLDDGGGQGWIPSPPNTTPGGLIQCTTAVWAVGGLDPLCCRKGIYWLLFRTLSFDILQGKSPEFLNGFFNPTKHLQRKVDELKITAKAAKKNQP